MRLRSLIALTFVLALCAYGSIAKTAHRRRNERFSPRFVIKATMVNGRGDRLFCAFKGKPQNRPGPATVQDDGLQRSTDWCRGEIGSQPNQGGIHAERVFRQRSQGISGEAGKRRDSGPKSRCLATCISHSSRQMFVCAPCNPLDELSPIALIFC